MTRTEEQLRDALNGVAELVHGTERARVPAARGRRRFSGWLVPATMAAVLLVVVAGVFTAASLRSPAAPKPVSPAGASGRYFVSLTAQGAGPAGNGAAVRDSATGEVVHVAPAPEGTEWSAAAATADGSSFYLVGSRGDAAGSLLYRLRPSTGASWRLDPVAGVDLPVVDGVAVSPDGTRLAYVKAGPRKTAVADHIEIHVVTLAGGHREVFQSSALIGAESLSWSADGARLGFAATFRGGRTELRILDAAAGHDLLKASRPVAERGLGQLTTPVLGADGSKVYVIAAQPAEDGGPSWTRLIEVDAASGRQLRVLFEQRHGDSSTNTVWNFTVLVRDASGRRLLLVSNGWGHRIDIGTARAERFPVPEGEPHSLAW